MMDDPNNPYRQNFDEPIASVRPQSNPLAIVGFVLAFCIPPIGLLLSFIAVFKAPRAFAIAGVIIGLIGTAILAIVAVGFSMFGPYIADSIEFVMETEQISQASAKYSTTHNGASPPDMAALQLPTDVTMDPWGQAYTLTPTDGGGWTLQSAGVDGSWGTADDITVDNTMDDNEVGEALGKSIEAHFKAKKSAPTP